MSDGTTREYYFAVYLNLLDYLVEQYHVGDVYERSRIAGICDEQLDRSGRLLGRVRDISRSRVPSPDIKSAE